MNCKVLNVCNDRICPNHTSTREEGDNSASLQSKKKLILVLIQCLGVGLKLNWVDKVNLSSSVPSLINKYHLFHTFFHVYLDCSSYFVLVKSINLRRVNVPILKLVVNIPFTINKTHISTVWFARYFATDRHPDNFI